MNSINIFSQKNCNVFKWKGDKCRYNACIYLEKAPKYFQLRKEFHNIYNKAIDICPEYSDAYRAKSVAYLKTGDFITWKSLIDKAVDIKPKDHLGYRGWCKFQFFRDYKGAIKDIELLESLVDYDIGYSQNGTYHLKIAKALCYKKLSKKEKAIQIIENHIKNNPKDINIYDYFHLGVLYIETKNYKKALDLFSKQQKDYNFAENEYYKAIAYKGLGKIELYKNHLQQAKVFYKNNIRMYDTYTHQIDKIYLQDIEKALQENHIYFRG